MAIDVGSIDASLSTGNVSYSGVGFQPKAVIFWGTLRTTSGATDDETSTEYRGMTDGLTSGCWTYSSGTGGPAGTSWSRQAVPIHAINRTGTVLFSASFVSFDNDGFTLNWGTAAGSGFDIHYMAIGGLDIDNVFVGSELITATGSAAITGMGFQPDGLIGFAEQPVSAVPSSATGAVNFFYSIGMTDGTTQGAIGGRRGNGFVTTESRITSNHWLNGGQGSGDKLRVALTTFDSDGFTYDATIVNTNFEVLYLAIKADSLKVGNIRLPAGTGSVAETGVGFQPEGIIAICLPGNWDGSTFQTTGNVVGSQASLGASDASNEVGAYWGWADDVTARDGGYSSSKSIFVEHPEINGNDEQPLALPAVKVAVTSLDSDGFTLSHTLADLRGGLFYMALLGGAVAANFDNKLIYADGISSV